MKDRFSPEAFEAEEQYYREQIARREFELLRREAPPSDNKKISDWSEYCDKLEKKISFSEPNWNVAASDLKPKEIAELKSNWPAIRETLGFDGSQYCPDWNSEIKAAAKKVSQYSSAAKTEQSEIDRYVRNQDYLSALKIEADLKSYQDVDESLSDAARTFWRNHINAELAAAESAAFAEHEKVLLDLNEYVLEREAFFGNDPMLNAARKNIIDAIAESWQEQIIAYGKSGQFREVYKFALQRLNDYSESEALADGWDYLKESIGVAFDDDRVLTAALKYYSNEASTEMDIYPGLSYVYVCLAKEMLDFRIHLGIDNVRLNSEGTTWVKRVDDLKDAVEAAVEKRQARNLVVIEADASVDLPDIDIKLRTELEGKYDAYNTNAWALTVLTDARDFTETNARDYVVNFKTVQLELDKKDRDSESKVSQRTSDYSTVENPFRKDKASEFYGEKEVIEQVVRNFLKSEKVMWYEYGKANVEIQLLRSGAVQPLMKGVSFENATLNRVTNVHYTFTHDTKAYYKIGETPAVDDNFVPNDVELRSKKESYSVIESAFSKLIAEELRIIVTKYPAEVCRDALAKRVTGSSKSYYNELGMILLYLVSMCESNALKNNEMDYEWYHLRDTVKTSADVWCERRWAEFDDKTKDLLKNLWEECTQYVEDAQN
ncbi:MAG: hypothetical protein JXR23_04890 [Pontiellaceae bacterium]|nr:hypothetical protein [Pontiellaceae bacterium]